MKKITFLLLFVGLLLSVNSHAQLPTTLNADYSTKTGTITDARDGKTYAYKTYGSTDWFVQNLTWSGSVTTAKGATLTSMFLADDPQGTLYGVLYPVNNSTATDDYSQFCPEGWTVPKIAQFKALAADLQTEYGLPDVVTSGTYKNVFTGLAKYMKAGGAIDTDANGLWKSGTIIHPKAAIVGFNALPSGVYNSTTSGFDSNEAIGDKASFVCENLDVFFLLATDDVFTTNKKTALIHHMSIRCVRPTETTKSDQTIDFPALPGMKIGDADYAIPATATSMLPIVFTSSNTSVATVVDGKIHVEGVGVTDITASQPGSGTFNPATSVTHQLIVATKSGLEEQIITFEGLGEVKEGVSSITLTATSSAGLTITYTSSNTNIATVSGNTLEIKGIGQVSITASQEGNANYEVADDVVRNLVVSTAASGGLPNFQHVSYSTKSGTEIDPRDGKEYAYKKYGLYDWFMQNLNWNGYDGEDLATTGSVGTWSKEDADGSKFGRFYLTESENPCPPTWRIAVRDEWGPFITSIKEEYQLTDLEDPTGNRYTFKEAMKYLRGGDIKPSHANALWDNKTGTIDAAKANEIQFNLLPSGDYTVNGSYVDTLGIGKRTWILAGGKDRYYNNYPDNDEKGNGINAIRHNTIRDDSRAYGVVRCIRLNIPDVEITTPYPTVFDVKQINSGEKETKRHKGRMYRYDRVPTAYYVEKGKSLSIKLEIVQQAGDAAVPSVIIGTIAQIDPFDSSTGQVTKTIELREGVNTITPEQHSGGLIHLRYVTQNAAEPTGKVRVTLLDEGDQVRVPHYLYGTTTAEEFIVMLNQYKTPEVVLSSDEVLAVTTHKSANLHSLVTDKNRWMGQLHKLLAVEDDISGLDNNDPNPLHHRSKVGEIRHLIVQAASGASPNASNWRTAYPGSSRYLLEITTPEKTTSNGSWQLGHEIGHQHQQLAWLIPGAGESTVNIYSLKVVEQFEMGGQNLPHVRTPQNKIEHIANTYLALSDKDRRYNVGKGAAGKDSMEIVTMSPEFPSGINRDEVRMVPWEQMFYMFGDEGDQFYKTLHRITREEGKDGGINEDDKRYYLITRASLISGYDMRKFFHAWGIKVDSPSYQKMIDDEIEAANLPEPENVGDLPYISGDKYKAGDYTGWLPLKLKGITTIVGIHENEGSNATSLNVYPNPVLAGQPISVDARSMSDILLKNFTITVYNSVGVLIKTQKMTDTVSSVTIPTSGIYIIKVASDTYKQDFKVIVK